MKKFAAAIIFTVSLTPIAYAHDQPASNQPQPIPDCFAGKWCMYKTTYLTYRLNTSYDTLEACEAAKQELYDDDSYGLLGILACAQTWD